MSSRTESPFKLGIVEGFFGLSWSWQARTDYADFLKDHHFNTYIYAPKSDRLLRADWHNPFPQQHQDKLSKLARHYRQLNLGFGIGLSPLELSQDFNTRKQKQLADKLEQINEINPSILCILFDDMQGDFPELAQQQTRVTDFIISKSQAAEFIFCPTYYSDDPRLAQHFGEKPSDYLEDLGKLLDPGIDFFWTGPEIFSRDYPADHLQNLAEKICRKPLIWDNYPVNDAQSLTDFLHLTPFQDHSRTLKKYCAGQLANPMNQAYLSQIPLFSLARYYQGNSVEKLFEKACRNFCSEQMAEQLLLDHRLFEEVGLKALSEAEKTELRTKYETFSDNPMASEIVAWLDDYFSFDPNCLS